MTARFISKYDFKLLDEINISNYSVEQTNESSGKTSVELFRVPHFDDEDCFLLIKNEDIKDELFIVDNIEDSNSSKSCKVSLIEMNNLFDRQIILSNENIKTETGIEDFIANQINNEFVQSSDTYINLDYIEVNALTHTIVNAAVETSDGIYNLKTYIDNARENYDIFIDYVINNNKLIINIQKKNIEKIKVNTNYDFIDIQENYTVNALTTLQVLWKVNDDGSATRKNYYLLNDRTISEDENNENRAKGTIKAVKIQAETEAALKEEVEKEFQSNSYEHSITAKLRMNSKIYSFKELLIGQKAYVKTSKGIRESILTSISYSDTSKYATLKFGKMPITFIEKLRKERR